MADGPATTRREALHALAMSLCGIGLGIGNPTYSTDLDKVLAATSGSKQRLVVYLSRSGNTRVIAGQLKRAFSADMFEIRTAKPWPDDYEEMVAWASRMQESATSPRLAESVSQIGKYDVIFLGSPIWGAALPAPVRSFLMTHDLSGKTVVPFFTYGCCGVGTAQETIAQLAPKARMLQSFSLKCDQERDTMNSVNAWLRSAQDQF